MRPVHFPLLWFLLIATCAGARADALPPALEVQADARILALGPHVSWWRDPGANKTLDEALAAADAGEFTPLGNNKPNFGFVDGAMWFRFDVVGGSDIATDWLLVSEYPLVDHIEVFRLDAAGAIRNWRGGDREPFARRALDLRFFNWQQTLAPGEHARFVIRTQSESSMQLPLLWVRAADYLDASQRFLLGLGAYFGVLAALAAYNLILFLSVRDRNFLSYVIYVSCVGWMLLCLTGLAFQYLWPDSPDWANQSVLLSMAASLASMLHFTRRFLDLRVHLPIGDALSKLLIWLSAIFATASLVLPYAWIVQALTLMVFPSALLIYVCAIACLRRFPPARYFLVSWTTLLVGIVAYALVSLGVLPKNMLTEYSIQIGSATEMVLLSFALAYRINVLAAERVRSQHEVREELERRVAERTSDLDAALRRLESANRRLEDFSRRDGLTGVFNRRSFEYILQRAERQRLEQASEYAVLMLDVDHFKRVNDDYGHLVGDDALRHLAQIIEPLVNDAGGQLARYGGEEFAVVLADCSLQQAAVLAKRICHTVADTPLNNGERSIPLTISVGVGYRGSDARGEAVESVRQADRALYQAKQAGRNRVVIG